MSIPFIKMLFAILASLDGKFALLDETGTAAYNADAGAYVNYYRNTGGVDVIFMINAGDGGANSFVFKCVMNTLPNEHDARKFIAEFVDWYNAGH